MRLLLLVRMAAAFAPPQNNGTALTNFLETAFSRNPFSQEGRIDKQVQHRVVESDFLEATSNGEALRGHHERQVLFGFDGIFLQGR
jgi:hypothetical protein